MQYTFEVSCSGDSPTLFSYIKFQYYFRFVGHFSSHALYCACGVHPMPYDFPIVGHFTLLPEDFFFWLHELGWQAIKLWTSLFGSQKRQNQFKSSLFTALLIFSIAMQSFKTMIDSYVKGGSSAKWMLGFVILLSFLSVAHAQKGERRGRRGLRVSTLQRRSTVAFSPLCRLHQTVTIHQSEHTLLAESAALFKQSL